MSEKRGLDPFFEPQGIVVVGARSTPGFGYGLPIRLKEDGWGDRTCLVNPRGGEIHGLPIYKSMAEVPGPVDLALVIVPAPAVPELLSQIGHRGIRNVIILSAGFAETGPEGETLQAEAQRVAKARQTTTSVKRSLILLHMATRSFHQEPVCGKIKGPGSRARRPSALRAARPVSRVLRGNRSPATFFQ